MNLTFLPLLVALCGFGSAGAAGNSSATATEGSRGTFDDSAADLQQFIETPPAFHGVVSNLVYQVRALIGWFMGLQTRSVQSHMWEQVFISFGMNSTIFRFRVSL